MEFGEFIGGVGTVDLLIVLYFIGFFVLGFAQGTIRRLLGIGSILFSFLLAANLAGPLSEFLGANWTQFSPEYSYMVGFGTVFVAASRRVRPRHPGLLQAPAAVPEGALRGRDHRRHPRPRPGRPDPRRGRRSSSTRSSCIPGIPADADELPFLREIWSALDASQIVQVFRETLIPAFFLLTGLPRPGRASKQMYPSA